MMNDYDDNALIIISLKNDQVKCGIVAYLYLY